VAFVKLESEAVRAVVASLPATSALSIRLRTILDLLPHLPDDVVIEVDTDGVCRHDGPADRPSEPGDAHGAVDPWPVGGPKMVNPPFGWRRHGKKVVRATEEREILRRVLQGVKLGWSNSQIANDLNGRALRTRRGSKWDGSGVGRLRKGALEHSMNAQLKERYG
jgi:hypothetical protein